MEKFDGFPVDKYSARFSGAFDLTPDEGDHLKYGETVVFVGVAVVGPATFNETRGGDISRTNVLKPREVVLVPAEAAEDLLISLGIPTQLRLDRPSEEDLPVDPLPVTSVLEAATEPEENVKEQKRELVAAAAGRRQYPTPSTVGASQSERDPLLARFLEER